MSTRGFRPDIEGLRAIAVVVVIADHLFGWPSGGFIGVDLFFVISGFLITGLLLKEHARTGRISFANFYKRRIRRILPASTLVLAVTAVATYFLFSAGRFTLVAKDAVWALFFSANWHLALVDTDYLQASGPVSPLQHYWSLSVEEQFYFVWPVLMVVVLGLQATTTSPTRRRALVLVLAGCAAASFGYALWETVTRPTWAYFSTASRAWELSAGALLAVAMPALGSIPQWVRPWLTRCGLLLIAGGLFFISTATPFPAPWAAVPVLAAVLIIGAGSGADPDVWRPNLLLANPLAGYLGKISYSLYLWHFPAIILLAPFFKARGLQYQLTVLGVAVAVAVLSFHLVEDPIRRSRWLDPSAVKSSPNGRRRKATHRGVSIPGVVVLIVMSTVCAVLVLKAFATTTVSTTATVAAASVSAGPTAETPGTEVDVALAATEWPELSPSVDELGKPAKVPEWIADGCLSSESGAMEDAQQNATRCVYGDPAAAKVAVLLGDSVAISYLPAIRAVLEPQGWQIRVLVMQQCPAADVTVTNADGSPHPGCDPFRAWAQDQVKQLQPDLVVMSSVDNSAERIVGAQDQQASVAAWEQGMTAAVAALAPATDRVLVLEAPPIGKNLQDCFTALSSPADCVASPSDLRASMVQAVASAAATQPNVTHVDTTPWFCNADLVCPAFLAGTPVFADGSHLTAAMSSHLAPQFAAALAAATPAGG